MIKPTLFERLDFLIFGHLIHFLYPTYFRQKYGIKSITSFFFIIGYPKNYSDSTQK